MKIEYHFYDKGKKIVLKILQTNEQIIYYLSRDKKVLINVVFNVNNYDANIDSEIFLGDLLDYWNSCNKEKNEIIDLSAKTVILYLEKYLSIVQAEKKYFEKENLKLVQLKDIAEG